MMHARLPPFDRRWAFFFDIDGTLSEIAPTPEDAFIPSDTLRDLALLRRATAVALISGRSLLSIDEITKGNRFPAAGQHGLELRFLDEDPLVPTAQRREIERLNDQIRVFQLKYPGLIIECKGLSIAVHYRMRPDLYGTVDAFLTSLVACRQDKMRLQYGKMVIEIRLRGADKGTAIERFMSSPEFSGKIPVFAGDDETDEDAHRVVNAMGGVSIQIGNNSRNALYSLASPAALRDWLHEVVTLELADA